MEVGNAWEPGRPVMSTLALRALLAFLDTGKLLLCQQFIYNNPARLPGPAQWVTVERIRVKDSYSHLWWMAANRSSKSYQQKNPPTLQRINAEAVKVEKIQCRRSSI